jgi:hypothetical protein
LHKAEQFIPELSWLFGVLAEVIGEAGKGGKQQAKINPRNLTQVSDFPLANTKIGCGLTAC